MPTTIIIRPEPGASGYWSDLWRQRELLYFLTWRDLLVRYRQTAIGIAWVLLRPALAMTAFTLIFGVLAKLPSDGIPYVLLVAGGLLPWQLFANAIGEAGGSLVENASMVTKVYFPRIIVPLSAILVSFADFLVSLALLAALMAWYGMAPDWRILTLPLFLALVIASSVGVGLWLAALNVKYRDFRYVLPFVAQITLYVSPVGFASALVPDAWRVLFSLNPLVGAIDGFRWAMFAGRTPLYLPGLAASVAVTLVLLLAGIRYFRRTEDGFADVI